LCYLSRGLIIETKSWLKKSKTRNLLNDQQYSVLIEKTSNNTSQIKCLSQVYW
jgi:hypothetical protein